MNRNLRFAAGRKWAKARIYSAVAACHMYKHRANKRVEMMLKKKAATVK